MDTMAAASQEGISPGNSQQLPVCAEMFLKDLSLFVRRKVGQWLVGKWGDIICAFQGSLYFWYWRFTALTIESVLLCHHSLRGDI